MGTEQNSSAKLTRGDLEKLIGGMVEKSVSALNLGGNSGGNSGGTGAPAGATGGNSAGSSGNGKSVAEQVRDALGQITKEREDKERNERIDEQLLKLQESNREKNPVERSWRHKLMGWGENET